MNSLEAKFILEACRAGDLDASDPKIAEALQVMEADPELAGWFAASQEFDRAVVAKLKAVPVPADLAARIRAGPSAAEPVPSRGSRKQWLAAAAGVMILGAIAVLFLPRSRPGDVTTFRRDMAEFMDRRWDRKFDRSDPEFAQLRRWLESRNDSIRLEVPLNLAASRTIGCKVLKWRGHTATLICFLPKSAGTVVHILVVDRGALLDAPGEAPQLARVANWNSALWSRGDKVYLALTTAADSKLTGCL